MFSVLVVTYNTDFNKLLITLKSIVLQKYRPVQIVISDDGSKENNFENVHQFFKEYGFTEYELVSHDKNQGTVKNILSGLEAVKGKYVKIISGGDALYDENTVEKIDAFMKSNNAEGCFGLLQGYHSLGNGKIKLTNFNSPFDIEVYRKNKDKVIKKNLVLYSDNTCGAAICYEREYCKEYLERIADYVVYEEDIFQVLSAIENRRLQFLDDYIVWYEKGEGISTKKNTRFQELLRQDVDRFYDKLSEEFADNSMVKKRNMVKGLYKINNLYVRTILRFFVNPDAIRYLLSHYIQVVLGKHHPVRNNTGFLECEEFWNGLF